MCGAFYFWFAGLGFGANVQRRWLLISLSMMKQCKRSMMLVYWCGWREVWRLAVL